MNKQSPESKNSFEKDAKKWQKQQAEAYREYVKTSAVGLEVGLAILVGALGGYFFDRHFHTSPTGLIVGLIIGAAAAGRRLWTFTKAYLKKENDDSKKEGRK